MTTTIIIVLCILILLAYIFDITASKTKIPSVILLLSLGWFVNQGLLFLGINFPDLARVLPILGTIGLILIVLEGSLELDFDKSKFKILTKSSLLAFTPMLIIAFGLAYAIYYFGNLSYKDALTNAIPFAIISSAIAIPSVNNLTPQNKEYITYESSISDIIGIIFFNFITFNEVIDGYSSGMFVLNIFIILGVSVVATIGLSYLLGKVKHQVKYIPIIILIILVYSITKIYHLPGLIFILIFGLFLGNIKKINLTQFVKQLHLDVLSNEVNKFKELLYEFSFLIRALFFLLFGFLIETKDLLNTETIIWALAITGAIFFIRFVFLKMLRMPVSPILFVAPRGLITILLFLSIPISQSTTLVNKSLIIQVILLSAFIMMLGLMQHKKEQN